MGKKVTIDLFDDFENELAADETIQFALEGKNYELDLSTKNANRLRKELEKWIEVSRTISSGSSSVRRRSVRSTASTSSGGESGLPLGEIREWAKANGHEVADKGRVSAEIVRAWKAATSDGPKLTGEVGQKFDAPPAKKAPAKKAADPAFSASS